MLLPGWLGPLVGVLHERGDAGAVGGRLLLPDGSLEEAGGTVFSDASALRFGFGEADPEAGLFDYVHPVDFCSGLLATPRELFLELDGFDGRFSSYLCSVIDYCFALRARGLRVYVQPASTAVHLETGASQALDQLADDGFV